jgi:hypothetical protein
MWTRRDYNRALLEFYKVNDYIEGMYRFCETFQLPITSVTSLANIVSSDNHNYNYDDDDDNNK